MDELGHSQKKGRLHLVDLAASSFLVDLAAYQVVLEACLAFLVVEAFPY